MSHNKHLQFTLELTVRQAIIIIAINSFNLYSFSHSEHKTLHRTYCMSYLLLSTCNFQSIESKSSVRNNIVMYQKQDENCTQRSLIAREVAPIFRIPWTRGFTLKEIFVKVTRNQGLDREVWTTFSYVDCWKNRNWVSEYGSVNFNRNIYWIVIITTRFLPIITSDRRSPRLRMGSHISAGALGRIFTMKLPCFVFHYLARYILQGTLRLAQKKRR